MRIGNVQGRPWLITGDGEGFDIGKASSGRFGPGLAEIYENWPEFAAWAPSADGEVKTFLPEDLGPPSPEPRQVFAVGLNYRDHAEEAELSIPAEPLTFTKYVTSFAGACVEVELPPGKVDWEVELVVVVGRTARRVAAADAWEHVAGLTVGQDISERDLQLIGPVPQFSLGKSFPGFSPTGPYLVTPDELDNLADLELGCSLNGQEVQRARTSLMLFPVDILIERLSRITTLMPGDVIFTGTPAGVGVHHTPPRFLAPGDELVSYIEGLGHIKQTFTAAKEGSAP
ncbi:fumarylacetoacetate hydrolase family protein [Streptomyces sp. NBC_00063]|uniref:fumarylacetoacetate hydrolase family protein n=1 Tax=Streptomyces sp. NBC_00063 TaxID=2975638 RepID=UPI003D74235E